MVLAQIWGPILVAFGIGVYLNPSYYVKVYRNLENETLAVMMAGIAALAVGIVQVMYHNVWATLPEIVLSLLGWATLLKGLMLLAYPKMANDFGDMVAEGNFFRIAAGVSIVLGGYLTYLAYF